MAEMFESRTGAGHRGPARMPDLDYSRWTFEELQALAIQLQLRDAERKSRGDLIELLSGQRPAPQHDH